MDMAVTTSVVRCIHVVYMPFLCNTVNSPGPCLPHCQAMKGHFDQRLDVLAGKLEAAKDEGWSNFARLPFTTG